MKLSRACGYALAALVHLARQQSAGHLTSRAIAESGGLSEKFLLKVLKPLASVGVLKSLKGPHGGYRLARPPNNISLLEVVEAVDGPIRGQVPQLTDTLSPLERRLEEVWQGVATTVRGMLEETTIADVAAKRKKG
jgi:Rrf2 family cysteine metabolism transcriptional repressor